MAFSLLKIITFIYLLAISQCIASLLSHHKECLALFELKQSFLHQDNASFDVGRFQKLDSWRKITSNVSDHDSDCCLWDGVVCSNKGHVIGLDLSQSSLHGSIKPNSSLFNLVHLQMLNLSGNDFVESQIPYEIARLRQLKSLDLSRSGFTGQIPIELSHLMQLTSLDLSWNPLKLQSPSFEDLLRNLTSLEELHLSGVDINSFIPPFLSNFSYLRSIDLESCRLRDQFPSKIFHLPNLKVLSVAKNPDLIGSLPEFQNNTLLERLNLYDTSFAGRIPQSISKLNHLVYLSLYACNFFGCIPCSLFNMTQLVALSLGQDERMGLIPTFPRRLSNSVGLEDCEKGRIHEWICRLTNLEVLMLVYVNIHGEILPCFSNLTKLSIVSMRQNTIYGRIPSSFMNLTQLSVIDITGNQLQGEISSSFSNFKSVKWLSLEDNNFSGELDLNKFVGLTKLRVLLLNDNTISLVNTYYTNLTQLPELTNLGLSSCNLREFPIFLRFQKKLEFLVLRNNKITGLVPEWILNNSKETLQILDLSNNSITGFHTYTHFLPWVRLEVFKITHNQLQGRIPIPPPTTFMYDVSNNKLIGEISPLLCEVKSLRVLDLSFNNMTGMLPPCLGNLANLLSVLDLKRNNFHGPIVNAFTHGSLVKRIDLSENQFTGKLPKSLANCTNLEFLALGGNRFKDAFPFWLGTLAKLQVLILHSNKFFGAIKGAGTIGSPFLKLRVIDISNNGFSGQLPQKFFQTWNAMKLVDVRKSSAMAISLHIDPRSLYQVRYSMTLTNKGVETDYPSILDIFTSIDLSCNNFEGVIPKSLYYLHGLQSINLSNNHLIGRISPSLENFKNLESLDLSRNKLAGEIPHELSQLNFLEVFNVSFNNLHGTIPQGKQFNTFDNNSYMGNSGLCGTPLSKKCQISRASTLPPTNNECGSFFPSDKTDWVILFLGVGSGLVTGIVLGNILYAKYGHCVMESSGMRKHIWTKPIRNTRRK